LEKLSYRQVPTLLDMYSFVNDAIAYAQDDEESRKGEAAFWA
jgi:hypothetical protein